MDCIAVVAEGPFVLACEMVCATDHFPHWQAIADILDDPDYDDGSIAPVLIRLAWHASGSYDKATNTGGSNGATIRFKPESAYGANAGGCSFAGQTSDLPRQQRTGCWR